MAVSQRVVAGVSIDERLTVGAYGAIHKAHTASRRDLRALMVDARLAAQSKFSAALLDEKVKGLLTSFDHPSVVPTLSIAKQGDELVVVTVGPGRHATVADLLAGGRKLAVEVAGSIAQAVAQALSAAHQRGLVHGAVHARSIAIDDAGHVKLCDFAVGRALTAAVAQGADGLTKGLTGTLPPEVALGEPPSAAGDVYAAGALLFTMLTGEPPPGALRVTPAVEKVIQKALDTDPTRRFTNGAQLLESLLEAYDDDRWSVADVAELRKLVLGRASAGSGAATDGNLDDDTEDLLATLGSAAKNVALTRQSVDIRAAAAAEKPRTKGNLDALLADLDSKEELTAVDASPPRRDPISEIIRADGAHRAKPPSRPQTPRKGGTDALTIPAGQSFDEPPDDHTPLPPPAIPDLDDSGQLLAMAVKGKAKARTGSPTRPGRSSSPMPLQPPPDGPRGVRKSDEIAALSAIADLDDRPPSEPPAASKPEPAAAKAAPAKAKPKPQTVQRVRPVSAIGLEDINPDLKVPRLKSRFWPVVWTLLVLGGGAAAVYVYLEQRKQNAVAEQDKLAKKEELAKKEAAALDALDDPGNVVVNSEPNEGSVYMLLGRTPMDYPLNSATVAFGLPTTQLLELRIELDSHVPVDTYVPGNLWSLDQGQDKLRFATLTVPLKVAKGRIKLSQQPPKPPASVSGGPFPPGKGVVHVETTPPGAAVWLFIGTTNNVRFNNLVAGKDYDFRVLKDGFLPGFAHVNAEDWRDGGDPGQPLSAAKKKETLIKSVILTPDPKASRP